NRVAHRLRSKGIGSGDVVGVAVERSARLAAVLLGVLKAGGTYVALEPGLPDGQLGYMASDAGVETVIGDEVGREALSGAGDRMIDADEVLFGDEMSENLEVAPDRDELAYVLYTSGTTGRPKGVMVPHRALVNHVYWWKRRHPFEKGERFVWQSPYSFDMSVAELFAPLANGAAIVPVVSGVEREPDRLAERIREAKVTRMRLVPTTLQLLLETSEFQRCDDLEKLYPGGEILTAEVRDRCLEMHPQLELFNLYGPTEACITATSDDGVACGETEPGRPPIGRPIDNVEIGVLGEGLEPVAVGVEGQLYLAGEGLARGYHRQPRRTATTFVPSNIGGDPGGRMYRTGDRVKW
ncbi:MAG: amino acid adenylation domain-containing protein, partial [Bradymonadaceae bacterium]